MSDSFDAIFDAFTTIEGAFPDAFQAAAGNAEKSRVKAVRDTARDAKDEALGKLFDESDAHVASLTSELQAANDQMSADLDGLKQVSVFLNLATSAANLAASLAALAA
jgi:hypothetical protein